MCCGTLTISPIFIASSSQGSPFDPTICCSQYSDRYSQNNNNYTSEHVQIFAVAISSSLISCWGSLPVNRESQKLE